MASLTVVFVHGWSVTNVDTYGELPLRLREEAQREGITINIKEIYLGRYISFHDEVRLNDISRAFDTALNTEILKKDKGRRFVCITHSTGGPVIRDWWRRYHPSGVCPMSHLIMLAPANYGSALAQLGKARVSRLKSWFQGVEPGQGVLDWLELGSHEAWMMNKEWILGDDSSIGTKGVFPFVLTGQSIDRKFYDHLNSYTGELGSDGVVRVAAANLEARYVRLEQPVPVKNSKGQLVSGDFTVAQFKKSPKTPFRIVAGKSHSGSTMGIMNSVKRKAGNDKSSETVGAILDCIKVKTRKDYDGVYSKFEEETKSVQEKERLEIEDRLLLADRYFIHDRFSMVIFRVVDSEGYPVKDYDLIMTAGPNDDPNHLPAGFFVDRQGNKLSRETITYFINYDVMHGADPVVDTRDNAIKEIRPALKGIDRLGFEIHPRPEKGFVHYLPCRIRATKDLFNMAFTPNSTTLIEICLQRLVHKEVFELDQLQQDKMPSKKEGDFKNIKPGGDLVT